MKRTLASLAKSITRLSMRSDLLWELVRKLPNHETFYRQRYSVIRKRARRRCAAELDAREVISGPFQGMKYAEEAAVGSSLWPKLLGTYESELADCLSTIQDRRYGRVIDVGYAEGYYLVGLGRLFNEAELIGFDTESEAQRLCRANAQVNGIPDSRLKLHGAFDAETFRQTLSAQRPTLVVVDCEGVENDVVASLDEDQISAVDWLIETHDHLVEGTTQRLLKAFEKSHQLTEVSTDVDLKSKCQLLPPSIRESCDTYVQEALVSEGRLDQQHWVFATRRAA